MQGRPSLLLQPTVFPRRDPSLYLLAPDASGGSWDLVRVSREFDGPAGRLTDTLIEEANRWAAEEPAFQALRLPEPDWERLPGEILLLDGSPSRMPLTAETARVMRAHLAALGLDIPVRVVNRREELLAHAAGTPHETLVLSQAAQRSLFDLPLARALTERGVILVPGPHTAPGGPLSNKKTTYELLNREPEEAGEGNEPLAARYEALNHEGEGPDATAGAILERARDLAGEWPRPTFFVKPQEGGGGRGCFRLDVLPGGFALPDLSRLGVTPEGAIPHPPLLDAHNPAHVRALAWVAHRFAASPETARAYLKTGNIAPRSMRRPPLARLARLLRGSPAALQAKLEAAAEPFERTRARLARAIDTYEQLYGVAYRPLICEWIDFGLFGLRVHLRMSRSGPVVESIYARLYPIEFNQEWLGVVGVDSITNRTEGGMEFNRYAPLVRPLVEVAGGVEALARRIRPAFHAFVRFAGLLTDEERARLPLRAEFDLSPLTGLIIEGNADPVRAQCANSPWGRFCENTAAWTEDALSYYSWKSRRT